MNQPELPPIPGHPEPHNMKWSELELQAIREYGKQCARAALATNVPADLCERICAAINAADEKSMDEANYMLDSNDCIAIVRAQFAAAPAQEADHFPAAGKLVEVAPAQAQQPSDDFRRGYEACVDSYKEAQLASYPLVTSWSASRGSVWIQFEDGSDKLEFEAAPVAPAQAQQSPERHLRRLLAVRVGMPHTYFDDGEAQGNEHGISIDFMREPVEHIDAKLRALNVARAECAKPEAQQPKPAAWINWSALTGEPRLGWQCESEIDSEPLYKKAKL